MTVEELLALRSTTGEADRWLFDGELIARWNGAGLHTPAHSAAVAAVSAVLGAWCRTHEPYRAFGYGCPYRLASDPGTLVTFDASVVRQTNAHRRRDREFIGSAPILAVEVVELDEGPDLLQQLVGISLRCGIATVWVIDPFEEIVAAHRRGAEPQFLNGGMLLQCTDLPGFSCSVAEIFE